jgi:hypothetical protein
MSKTPSLQLLGALFSAIAYFTGERLPHLEIHQSTLRKSKSASQHTDGKGWNLPPVRLPIPHYVPQSFVARLNA